MGILFFGMSPAPSPLCGARKASPLSGQDRPLCDWEFLGAVPEGLLAPNESLSSLDSREGIRVSQ